jgi:hypothetical protein
MRVPIEKCPAYFLEETVKFKNTLFLACIRDWQDVRYAVG